MRSAQKIIEDIIENEEVESDAHLYEMVCKDYMLEHHAINFLHISAQGFFDMLKAGQLPMPETVRRARQKLSVAMTPAETIIEDLPELEEVVVRRSAV